MIETEVSNLRIELERATSKVRDAERDSDAWAKKCQAIEKSH